MMHEELAILQHMESSMRHPASIEAQRQAQQEQQEKVSFGGRYGMIVIACHVNSSIRKV